MSSTSALLDLKELNLRGGEEWERNYRVEVSPIRLGGVDYQILLPDGADLAVRRVTGGYLVDLSARVGAYGPCSRCLKEAVLDLTAEEEEFVPTSDEGWDERDLSPFIEDQVVDVAGLAREAIVLALPNLVLCDDACAGLCPTCGNDLNRGPCGCPPPEPSDRWGKLRELELVGSQDQRREAKGQSEDEFSGEAACDAPGDQTIGV
jgi:uncharacterized protein